MQDIGPRLGFPPPDVTVLVDLVRHHLLLADAATRRDLRDPATVTRVAAAVTSTLTLELLDALTEADARATGDTAWSPWKESLVRELVARVATVLEGEQPGRGTDLPAAEYQQALARASHTNASVAMRPSPPNSSTGRRHAAAPETLSSMPARHPV